MTTSSRLTAQSSSRRLQLIAFAGVTALSVSVLSGVTTATAAVKAGSACKAKDAGKASGKLTCTKEGTKYVYRAAAAAAPAAPAATSAPAPAPAAAPAEGKAISAECNIPNPANRVTLDVLGWEFPIVTQYGKELKECAKDSNYNFNVQFLDATTARAQGTLDLQTGKPSYEIIQGSNTHIADLANAGLLLPLDDLFAKYKTKYSLDKIDPAFIEMGKIGGKLYTIPMVSNTMHMFYNKTVLDRLNLKPPTTYEEVLRICPTLNKAGYDTGYGDPLNSAGAWQVEFDNVLGSFGLASVNADGTTNWTTPEAVKAVNILERLWLVCGPKANKSYSLDDFQNGYQTGELVLGNLWASRANAMDDPKASKVIGQIQFAPSPAVKAGAPLGAPAYIDGYAIPKNTSVDPETIFLAILGATDLESQNAAAEFGLVTRSDATNAKSPRNAVAAATSLTKGRGKDSSAKAAGVARAKLGAALLTILDGVEAEKALAQAQKTYIEEATKQGLLK